MAQFAIGGLVGGGTRKNRRAISCIYEDDEGPHSLDRFLRAGGPILARKFFPEWQSSEPTPFLSLQLHSEYRSTYKWHEFTPKQGQDVVRNPPLSSNGKKFTFLLQKPKY
jgi:hypothetical protein